MNRKAYATDLTDDEWTLIAPFIPPARRGARSRSTDMREVCNTVFYITRIGCVWRLLPHELPKWQTIYHYYCRSRLSGLWARMHRRLCCRVHQLASHAEQPTAVAMGSQTEKATATTGQRSSTAGNVAFWSIRVGCSDAPEGLRRRYP